jgi:hypothetical protein
MAREDNQDSYRYSGHINWRWVLDCAMIEIAKAGPRDNLERVSRMRELSSHSHVQSKRGYALFRVEMEQQDKLLAIWATSPAFEYLDPKDALFEAFDSVGVADVMPRTRLLPWTCGSIDEVGELPTVPALLKAPLGSAGDCLYFVQSAEDVVCVARNHKQRAEAAPNFVEGLVEKYGKVPSWSLQELFPTLVLRNSRKCQLRAYLVFCSTGELFLYSDYEIRQPHWEDEGDTTSLSSAPPQISPLLQADLDVCLHSSAVPYNHRRHKPSTSRLMLDEVEELKDHHTAERVTELITRAFRPLRDQILAHAQTEFPPRGDGPLALHEMAVAGLDLLIDSFSFEPKIVELNNNPAMPQEGKMMTAQYRLHLQSLVRNIIGLGLGCHGAEPVLKCRDKFHQIF